MGNDWKAPHGVIFGGPLSGVHRRDVDVMMKNEKLEELQEIEITLRVRILLNDKDMDGATYQEMFNLLKELNR